MLLDAARIEAPPPLSLSLYERLPFYDCRVNERWRVAAAAGLRRRREETPASQFDFFWHRGKLTA